MWVREASQRVNGKEHPDTLRSTTNLAGTYRMQDKFAEAEGRRVVQVGLLPGQPPADQRVHLRTNTAPSRCLAIRPASLNISLPCPGWVGGFTATAHSTHQSPNTRIA